MEKIGSFGEFPPFVEETFEYFEDALIKDLELPFLFKTPKQWTEECTPWEAQKRWKKGEMNKLLTVNGGRARGRLIGRNLNTMKGIWNTEYMPNWIDESWRTENHYQR